MAEAANVLANFGVCVFFFLPLNSEWPRLLTFWLILVCVCFFFLPLNSEWPRQPTFWLIFFSHLCSQDDDWENWD